MAEEYRRIAVPEVVRPFFTLRFAALLILLVLVGLWVRQSVVADRKPTMRLVQPQQLRTVALPPDFVPPPVAAEKPPAVSPAATPEELERAFQASDRAPRPAIPVPPDSDLPAE